MMKKYKFLLFDADNTLLDFTRSEEAAIRSTMTHSGILPTNELCVSYSRINDGLWKALERKEIDKATLKTLRFEIFVKENSLTADPKLMARLYVENLSKQPFVIDGAKELLLSLQNDYEIYIITNGIGFVQRGRMGASSINGLYKKLYISEDIGYEKPDKRYFERVFADIENFDRSRTLIIGDSLSSDIKGALNCSVDCCYFSSNGKIPSGDIRPTYTITKLSQLHDILDPKTQNP